jgi:hypothetical protein
MVNLAVALSWEQLPRTVAIMAFTGRANPHNGPLGDLPATGRAAQVEVRRGQVVREREYFDKMSILEQLGVAPW